jgi:hypothetical protein
MVTAAMAAEPTSGICLRLQHQSLPVDGRRSVCRAGCDYPAAGANEIAIADINGDGEACCFADGVALPQQRIRRAGRTCV